MKAILTRYHGPTDTKGAKTMKTQGTEDYGPFNSAIKLFDQLSKVTAERDRLREALKRLMVTHSRHYQCKHNDCDDCKFFYEQAKQALNHKERQEP